MRKILAISVMVLLIAVQCSNDENSIEKPEADFAIYLLKNQDLKIGDILTKALADQDSIELSKIEIQDCPWLTDDDIVFYDFSSHIAYLKQEKSHFLLQTNEQLFPADWINKPFVVLAEGQKRYIGVFSSGSSLDNWPVPEINDVFNFWLYPNDLLLIHWSWYPSSDLNDARNDSLVKKALLKAGILHEGIKLEISNIHLAENSDTSTVVYTYTIINNDLENLYVLDPYKMENGLFNFYNNGPSFLKPDETRTRESKLMKVTLPDPIDSWNPEWFIKIASGDSITRTISLKGYTYFPSGTYYCELFFQGIKKIPKNQRLVQDGRYWIGQTVSNLIVVEY
jgi:hypothetical protein